jgi:hypothetical protein
LCGTRVAFYSVEEFPYSSNGRLIEGAGYDVEFSTDLFDVRCTSARHRLKGVLHCLSPSNMYSGPSRCRHVLHEPTGVTGQVQPGRVVEVSVEVARGVDRGDGVLANDQRCSPLVTRTRYEQVPISRLTVL